jgi:hypothetical protein
LREPHRETCRSQPLKPHAVDVAAFVLFDLEPHLNDAVSPTLDFNSFPPFRLWRSLQRFELTWVYFCVRIF